LLWLLICPPLRESREDRALWADPWVLLWLFDISATP